MNCLFRLPFPALAIALSLAGSLAGCNSAEAPLPGEPDPASQTGNAQDMRAAQSLSIGSVRALDEDNGPYVQALRCSMALDAINERFAESGGFSDEQMRLLREAQAIYERQFAQLGAQDNKSREDMRGDLDAQAERIPELSTRGQIAIGCLRRLA